MKNPFKYKSSVDNHTGEVKHYTVAPIYVKVITTIKQTTLNIMSRFRQIPKGVYETYERDPYCQISIEAMMIYPNLTVKSQRLFTYIACNVEFGYNFVYLPFDKLKEFIGVKSDLQIYQALKELRDNNIIREIAGNKDMYSVNHNYIFRGDYNKFIDKVKDEYNLNDENDSDGKYDNIVEDKYVGRVRRCYLKDLEKNKEECKDELLGKVIVNFNKNF